MTSDGPKKCTRESLALPTPSGVQLILDASTRGFSFGFHLPSGELVSFSNVGSRQATTIHSSPLTDIEDGLREVGYTPHELTHVIVGSGPGSFTGLRVAFALAKGICQGAGISLSLVNSLQALIAARISDPSLDLSCQFILALADARREECFCELFVREESTDFVRCDFPLIQKVRDLPNALSASERGFCMKDGLVICADTEGVNWTKDISLELEARITKGLVLAKELGLSRDYHSPQELSQASPNYVRRVNAQTISERQGLGQTGAHPNRE